MTAANQHDAPQLDHLFASYLNAELANDFGPAFGSEVELYDAGTAWRCEPKAAWDDACAAVRLQPTAPADFKVAAPADWGTTANIAAAVAALPLAAGSFPQLVRDLPSLIGAERLADLRPTGNRPAAPASAAFQTWAFQTAQQHGMPSALLVIGVLRLAGQTELAAKVLAEQKATCPTEWRAALANEEAALAWAEGRWDEAAERWRTLPATVPVLFNRGVADLFLDRPAEARASFKQAIAQLPEESGWHHLAQLYLALAEMRG